MDKNIQVVSEGSNGLVVARSVEMQPDDAKKIAIDKARTMRQAVYVLQVAVRKFLIRRRQENKRTRLKNSITSNNENMDFAEFVRTGKSGVRVERKVVVVGHGEQRQLYRECLSMTIQQIVQGFVVTLTIEPNDVNEWKLVNVDVR